MITAVGNGDGVDNGGGPDTVVLRRAFLGVAGRCATVFALGGLLGFSGRNDSFTRPPRARPEEEFLSLCIRCDKCALVCPSGSISPVRVAESIVGAGTPVLQGDCRGCLACVLVCPTGALDWLGYKF